MDEGFRVDLEISWILIIYLREGKSRGHILIIVV